PQDTRMRLRSALRRNVQDIWILIDSHGRDRIALVQVYFEPKGRSRDFFIYDRPRHLTHRANRPGHTVALTIPYDSLQDRGHDPSLADYRTNPRVKAGFNRQLADLGKAARDLIAADVKGKEEYPKRVAEIGERHRKRLIEIEEEHQKELAD